MSDPVDVLKENQVRRVQLDLELGLVRAQQKEAKSVTEREMLQKQTDTIMEGYKDIFYKNMMLFGEIIDNIKSYSNHPHNKQEPALEPIQGQTLLEERPLSPWIADDTSCAWPCTTCMCSHLRTLPFLFEVWNA